MREGFEHARGIPHLLVFPDNRPNFPLRGKAKGAETILREPTYGRRMVGGLMVSSSSASAQKNDVKTGLLILMPVAANPRWAVPLAAALAEYSPSNKTSRNKRANYKKW